jgi:peptide-methionine (S)-S-oxide reductase
MSLLEPSWQLLFVGISCLAGMVVSGQAETPKTESRETATFAAGCFWGVQLKFDNIKGVLDSSVGYTGGTVKNPTYEQVCTHTTGHAEAVQLHFDPTVVTYQQLVDAFFAMHDPTQLNRQGPDIGSSYRSAIFYHSPEQKAIAEAAKQKLNAEGKYKGRVVTEIVPAGEFYAGEDYHQKFLEKRGGPACH